MVKPFNSCGPDNEPAIPKHILVDHSPVAMYTCDLLGRITYYNRAAAQLWGREPKIGQELWSGSWKTYYPDGTPMPLDETPMAAILKNKNSFDQSEITIECPDHSFKTLLVFPRQLFSDQGTFIGAYNTLVDISYKENLETRDAFLSAIVEHSQDPIISKNLNGIITSWNKGAEKVFGYQEQEMLGKPITTIIPADRLDEETFILDRIRKGKIVDHFETIRVRKDGRKIPISLMISPIRNGSGKIIGASKIARDISEQIKTQEAIAQYTEDLETISSISRTISEKLDVQKILQEVTDATTRLTGAAFGAFFYKMINEEGEAYTLYSSSGAPKEAFEEFGLPRNTAVFHTTFSGEGPVRSDDITKDPRYGHSPSGIPKGHLPVVSYLAMPVVLSDSKVIGGLFFGHPLPGRFNARHEKLVASIAAQAATALDNARLFEEVVSLSTRKDEFIAMASHELNSPLTSVKGFLQLLNKKNRDATCGSFIDISMKQIGKLQKLVSDLLDVSKIKAEKLQIEKDRFDCKALLEDVIQTYVQDITNHSFNLKLNCQEVFVVADKLRIEQVIVNLVSNAVKYSPKSTTVFITLEKRATDLIIKVADQGIGLREEEVTKVFGRFYRAEERGIAGLGLGLYICSEIVRRHGGEIGVNSEYGRGSEFYFTLPLAIERQADK
jgi:PAS domain S-box-containing protein